MPITWRNINAPSFGAANALLARSGQQVSEGLNSIAAIARQQGQEAQKDLDVQKDKNTQTVLERINAIGSMEEHGKTDINSLMEGFGDQIDRKSIMSAFNQRDNEIRDEYVSEQNFADIQERNTDEYKAIKTALAANDLDLAENLLDKVELRDESGFEAEIVSKKKGLKKEAQADEDRKIALRRAAKKEAQDDEMYFNAKVDRLAKEELQETVLTSQDTMATIDGIYQGVVANNPTIPNLNLEDTATAAEATNDWLNSLDDVDSDGIEEIQGDIKKVFTDNKFSAVDPVTGKTKNYAFNDIPAWVLRQSLLEAGVNRDWIGDDDLKNPAKFKKSIDENLIRYNRSKANSQIVAKAKAKRDSDTYAEQVRLINKRKAKKAEISQRLRK